MNDSAIVPIQIQIEPQLRIDPKEIITSPLKEREDRATYFANVKK
jgi:hypothetical protein